MDKQQRATRSTGTDGGLCVCSCSCPECATKHMDMAALAFGRVRPPLITPAAHLFSCSSLCSSLRHSVMEAPGTCNNSTDAPI